MINPKMVNNGIHSTWRLSFMAIFRNGSLIILAFCIIGSCTNQRPTGYCESHQPNSVTAFNVARDGKQPLNIRMNAASQLNRDQKRQLENELLQEIQGDDLKAANAIYLLGEIGDTETLKKLNAFFRTPTNKWGQINTATLWAIDEIQKRNAQ